jgi:CHAT domain-containing protein/tetratricopeptide (TPR) repeat protein
MASTRSRSSSAPKRTSKGRSSTSPADAGQASARAPRELREIVTLNETAKRAEEEERFAAAVQARLQAVDVGVELKRPALLAVLMQRLGRTLELAGERQAVVVAYEKAMKALDDEPDGLQRSVSAIHDVINKAYTFGLGTPDPVDLYSSTLAADLEAAERDPRLRVKLLIDVGNAYLEQPQDGVAEHHYQEALAALDKPARPKRSRSKGDSSVAAEVNELRAHILCSLAAIRRRRGDLDGAEALATQALEIFGDGSLGRRRPLAILAGVAGDRGGLSVALKGYQEALSLAEEAADLIGKCRYLTSMGFLHLKGSKITLAKEAFTEASEIAEARGAYDVTFRALFGLGLCHKDEGNLDAAAELLTAATMRASARSKSLDTDEGRVSFLQGVGPIDDHLVDVCLRRVGARTGSVEDALTVIEESRAKVLGSEPDTLEIAPNRLQVAVGQSLSARRARLRAKTSPEPLARLVYHVLPDRTAVIVVTRDSAPRAHVAAITSEELSARVKAVRTALGVEGSQGDLRVGVRGPAGPKKQKKQTSKRPSAEELLSSLYALLIAPVIEFVPKDAPLVIEPHGALWLLPFAALRGPDGAPLGDRNALLYAPSERVLDYLRRIEPLGAPSSLRALVVGNPTMPEIRSADGTTVTLRSLGGAEDEARAIAELFGERASLLIGPDATESAVTEAMANAAVIHLATHGIADSADPLASMVVLAPNAGGDEANGILTARELMALHLVADLVTLSACQTALGKISGEGVLGLSRTLLWAGARTLIVSQWSVEDDATQELMVELYKAFLDGEGAATALQRASRALRDLDPRYEHPRFWAPFVVIGAGA